ncbi:MAG: hypothetical protein ACKVQU_01640 [Burkholderiales bacterium]
MINVSINSKRAISYPPPYMTLALAETGKAAEAEAMVRSFRERARPDFYWIIAQAYLDAMGGRHEPSREKLWEAFASRPPYRALAIGLYLDPLSDRLAGIDADTQREALARLAQSNPFHAKNR